MTVLAVRMRALHCVDLKQVIGGPHGSLQLVHIVVNYSQSFLHPHLSGSASGYWPFKLRVRLLPSGRSTLAAIVEVGLHQRVFETNWHILPVSEEQEEEGRQTVKKLAHQRIEAFYAFVEQQGWQQPEALPPSSAPLAGRDFVVTDGETSVTVSVYFEGGLDLRGDGGKLKTALLEWIRQIQPKAMVLRREQRSSPSSTTSLRGKAWKYERGSWMPIEEIIYNRLREEEGPDLEEAIRQAGYESRLPIRLGVPESSFCVEVYTSQKGENAPFPRYPYFVGVQMPTEYECIYVTDFPSLVSLLGQLGFITDKVRDISE